MHEIWWILIALNVYGIVRYRKQIWRNMWYWGNFYADYYHNLRGVWKKEKEKKDNGGEENE